MEKDEIDNKEEAKSELTTLDCGDGWSLFIIPVELKPLDESNSVLFPLMFPETNEYFKSVAFGKNNIKFDSNALTIRIWLVKDDGSSNQNGVFVVDKEYAIYNLLPFDFLKDVKERDKIPEIHVYGWRYGTGMFPERKHYDMIFHNVNVLQTQFRYSNYGNFEEVIQKLYKEHQDK